VLRFTGKGLNVRKVRLALSRLARFAYEAFYKAIIIKPSVKQILVFFYTLSEADILLPG